MKILLQNGNKIIAELTEGELVNILGFHSTYSTEYKNYRDENIKSEYGKGPCWTGKTIPVEGIYNYVSKVMQSRESVEAAADAMLDLAAKIQSGLPKIELEDQS